MKDCTFKPKTNHKSQKLVQGKREAYGRPGYEILYEQNGKKI